MGHRRESELPAPHGHRACGNEPCRFWWTCRLLGASHPCGCRSESAGPRQTIALFDTMDEVLQLRALPRLMISKALPISRMSSHRRRQLALTELEGEAMRIEVTGGQGARR